MHRLDEIVRSGREAFQQLVCPLGLFGGAPDHTAHQKELRIVASMSFGVDRFQLMTLRGIVPESRNRSTSS
jgi:hypothetical protein